MKTSKWKPEGMEAIPDVHQGQGYQLTGLWFMQAVTEPEFEPRQPYSSALSLSHGPPNIP